MSTVREVLERQAAERNSQMDADITSVLSTVAGRRVLMGLLARSGVWARTGCGDGDAIRLAYAAGRRDGGADLLAACNRVAANLVECAMGENNARVVQWNDDIKTAKIKEQERNRQ